MISENIESIGIELECGVPYDELEYFKDKLYETFPEHLEWGGDGSLSFEDEYSPREIKYWHTKLSKLKEFLNFCYKTVETNSTCGFHVHVRFKDMGVAKLFSFKPLFEEFIERYKVLAGRQGNRRRDYLDRLSNHYCRGDYTTSKIINQLESNSKCDSRYCAINLNSLNVHRTLEFRVLPFQETADESIKSLRWLIKTIESLIRKDFNVRARTIEVNPINGLFEPITVDVNYRVLA